MKLFKKLAVTVNSQVEAVADRFENREALSSAYIGEYEKVVAKSQVKLTQIDNEVNRLLRDVNKYKEAAEVWAERARRVHSTDNEKALECISRMTVVQKKQKAAEVDLKETQGLKDKMAQDLDYVHEKLNTLKRRHRNLSGRQVCANAVHTIQQVDGTIQQDIDNLFNRWETEVVTTELRSNTQQEGYDPLAEEFNNLENKEALQQTLNDLLATSTKTKEK